MTMSTYEHVERKLFMAGEVFVVVKKVLVVAAEVLAEEEVFVVQRKQNS